MSHRPLAWRLADPAELQRCGAQPSKRSTARCEDTPDHLAKGRDVHAGRTPRGYWKFWREVPQ